MSHRKRRAGDPVVREGDDGLYSWASSACRALLGWEADELIGRPAADFIHPDDRLRATDGAYRHLRKDGGFTWVEPRWLPGRDAGPERVLVPVACPAGVAEALRAAEQRFELAFDDGQIGMAVVSLDGTWLRVNPALCRIVGYTEEQLLGARIQDITHPDDLEKDLGHMAEMVRGERRRYGMEKRYVRGDGQLAWVWLSVSVATDERGAPAHFISQVQDMTEHRRHERLLQESAREHAALHRVSAAVAQGIGEEALWALVAREAAGLFSVETAIVTRFLGSQAIVMGAHGGEFDLGTRLSISGPGVLAQVARTRACARIDDYGDLGAGTLLRHQAMARGLSASVAAPIMVDGEAWGALLASTADSSGFAGDAADRLARFAELVALGIANAQARSELLSRAMTDALTGLTNHRAFHERLAVEVERADRHGRHLAVAVMDLDHFKAVNDTYGHPVGDRVLRELADRLRGLTRPEDEFARVGGEEFALILPECDPRAAVSILERMRRAVADTPFAEVRRPITISIGVAQLSDANGPNELYQQADEALYLAKAEGRDRIASWERGLVAAPVAGAPEPGERQRTVEGILALARAVDARDPGMRRHSGRVADLAVRLATVLGWRIEDCALLRDAGLVHDVGKIGVSDSILLKAGRLTAQEREQVQLHAALGAQIARDVLTYDQVCWVKSHHERWDGDGYPEGLAGEQIPAGARILAVADAFDHMTAARSYMRTRSVEEALAECRRLAGVQFAPEVVVALERLAEVGALARSDTP